MTHREGPVSCPYPRGNHTDGAEPPTTATAESDTDHALQR